MRDRGGIADFAAVPAMVSRFLANIFGLGHTHGWRRGRVAEGGGLLNRYTLQRRIEGSNPSVSASQVAT